MSRLTNVNVIRAWVGYNEQPWRVVDGTRITDGFNGPDGSADNLSFDRQVLRSYRLPIACYHSSPFVGEKGFCLVLSQKVDSPWQTTSKHISMAMRAVKLVQFSVPYIGAANGYPYTLPWDENHGNLSHMLCLINETANRSVKGFKYRGEDGWSSAGACASIIENTYHEIERYMTMTGAKFPELPKLDDILSWINDEREWRWAKWSDPKAMAKRERIAARKAAIKALGLEKEDDQ